jgi:hypothetical protein
MRARAACQSRGRAPGATLLACSRGNTLPRPAHDLRPRTTLFCYAPCARVLCVAFAPPSPRAPVTPELWRPRSGFLHPHRCPTSGRPPELLGPLVAARWRRTPLRSVNLLRSRDTHRAFALSAVYLAAHCSAPSRLSLLLASNTARMCCSVPWTGPPHRRRLAPPCFQKEQPRTPLAKAFLRTFVCQVWCGSVHTRCAFIGSRTSAERPMEAVRNGAHQPAR